MELRNFHWKSDFLRKFYTMKIWSYTVIVRGAAEHYYCFLPALREQLIQNTTATRTVTN